MSALHRVHIHRRRDPWWDLEGVSARRRRRLKLVVDFGILAAAIITLALVFGSRPVVGL